MKLILPLSALIDYHIIQNADMTAYLMSMKPPRKTCLSQHHLSIAANQSEANASRNFFF
jgi:hypothetical protein